MTSDSKNIKTVAIILAAGTGSRLGASVNKQRVLLDGKSIITRTVEVFNNCIDIDGIVVVTRFEDLDFVKSELLFASGKLIDVIVGGDSRAESAKIGFSVLPEDATHVAIHDGARCLISANDISAVVRGAHKFGCASAVSKVTNTVKRITSGVIKNTVQRDDLYFAETPQVFSVEIYKKALSVADNLDNVTDDNMLVENIGMDIVAVTLSQDNPKITYPKDIEYAEFLIKRRNNKC